MYSLTHAYIEKENKIVRRAQVDAALARFNDELIGQLTFEKADLTSQSAVAFSWNWNTDHDGIFITMLYTKLPTAKSYGLDLKECCPVAGRIHGSLTLIFPDIAINISGVSLFTEQAEQHYHSLAERENLALSIKTRL